MPPKQNEQLLSVSIVRITIGVDGSIGAASTIIEEDAMPRYSVEEFLEIN